MHQLKIVVYRPWQQQLQRIFYIIFSLSHTAKIQLFSTSPHRNLRQSPYLSTLRDYATSSVTTRCCIFDDITSVVFFRTAQRDCGTPSVMTRCYIFCDITSVVYLRTAICDCGTPSVMTRCSENYSASFESNYPMPCISSNQGCFTVIETIKEFEKIKIQLPNTYYFVRINNIYL